MTRPGAPALDRPRADRWASAAVPWWVTRVLMTTGCLVAVVIAAAGDTAPCTAADPGVCGPDMWFAWAAVPLLATPVLLWWLPLGGCVAGLLFAVLDLMFDDVASARLAFGVHGLACGAVACWLLAARRRQAAVIGEVAVPVRVDAALAERLRSGTAGWGARTVAAGALVLAGLAGIGWYGHQADTVAAHVAAAARLDATVRAVDDDEAVITVEVPPRVPPTRLDVLTTASYRVGQVVPVLVDRGGTAPWVRLVAEPDDPTGWFAAGLGAFALAGVLLIREQRMRSARRRLLRGPVPAVQVWTRPDDNGHAALQVGTGTHRMLLGVVPVVAAPTPGHPTEVDEPPGTRPEVVTVLGDLRDGGWVLLVTDSAVLAPEAPVRLPRRWPWQAPPRPPGSEPLPGRPVPPPDGFATVAGVVPDLPVVLWSRRRDRVIGALQLLGFAVGPAIVLAGLPVGWWQTMVTLCVGGLVGSEGWGRLFRRVRLTRGALVVHDGIQTHHVPWHRLHGVRREDDRLFLAWDPDVIVEVGAVTPPGADVGAGTAGIPAAEYWGAVMMRLRHLALAAGDPGGQVDSRVGGSVPVFGAYLLMVLALLWWQHR